MQHRWADESGKRITGVSGRMLRNPKGLSQLTMQMASRSSVTTSERDLGPAAD